MIYYRTLGSRQLWDKQEKDDFHKDAFINRDMLGKLIRQLSSRKIDVIYGPRQSGKTTLLKFLIEYLNTSGVSEADIWYVNLDLIADHGLFDKPGHFIYLYDQLQVKRKVYLFIDEIQRLKNPGLFLKGIYDSGRDIKVLVSGSASFEIKAITKEYLTGRKRLHLLLPLSFSEVIHSSGIIPSGLYGQKLRENTVEDWIQADDIYRKYLREEFENIAVHGLYPAVYASPARDTKVEELHEIYNSYLKKDVFDYFRVERPEVFNNLVKVLADQTGNIINVSELSSLLSGNRTTIERYLQILKDTYVVSLLKPFTTNRRNEVKYAPKVFFNDLGIRNLALKSLSPLTTRFDAGGMIENLVFIEMQKKLEILDDLYYWRTKNKSEVDFIYSREDRVIPIEVKTGSAKIGTLTRSFHSYINIHKPQKAVFLNKDRFAYFRVDQTDVYYIPVHWFLIYGPAIL